MNAFAADDLEAAGIEAADLLALARLDDDGAPYPRSLERSEPPLAPTRTMIAMARPGADLLLMTPPEGSGEHATGSSADLHPPVPANAPG
jgi:hypothetical protein